MGQLGMRVRKVSRPTSTATNHVLRSPVKESRGGEDQGERGSWVWI